jgi:hypothetical protein
MVVPRALHTHTKTGGRSPLPFSLVPFFHQDFLFFFFLPFHLRLVEKISSFSLFIKTGKEFLVNFNGRSSK